MCLHDFSDKKEKQGESSGQTNLEEHPTENPLQATLDPAPSLSSLGPGRKLLLRFPQLRRRF